MTLPSTTSGSSAAPSERTEASAGPPAAAGEWSAWSGSNMHPPWPPLAPLCSSPSSAGTGSRTGAHRGPGEGGSSPSSPFPGPRTATRKATAVPPSSSPPCPPPSLHWGEWEPPLLEKPPQSSPLPAAEWLCPGAPSRCFPPPPQTRCPQLSYRLLLLAPGAPGGPSALQGRGSRCLRLGPSQALLRSPSAFSPQVPPPNTPKAPLFCPRSFGVAAAETFISGSSNKPSRLHPCWLRDCGGGEWVEEWMLAQELPSVSGSVGRWAGGSHRPSPCQGSQKAAPVTGWQRRAESLMQGQPPPQTLASPPRKSASGVGAAWGFVPRQSTSLPPIS